MLIRFVWVALTGFLIAAACGETTGGTGQRTPSPTSTVSTAFSATASSGESGTVEDLEIHHLLEADAGGTYRAQGSTDLRSTRGEGWELIAVERFAGGPRGVAVATSPLGMARMWTVWGLLSPTPVINFEADMLIGLAVSVSGSCPDLAFDGLVIADSRVFGRFEELRSGSQMCTADANPVTFLFVVDRQKLPQRFELSAREEPPCPSCSLDVVTIDLTDDAALEATMWGPGRWEIAIEGTPPEPGVFNAVLFDSGTPNALLFSPRSWEEFKGTIQSIPADRGTLVEGFVASCDLEQCEECLGAECDLIDRLGEGCALEVEPVPYRDGIVRIAFDGTDCSITVETSGEDGSEP